MEKPITLSMSDSSNQKIAQIVKNYGKGLFGFIRSKVSSHEDAEDILQEVWFQLSRLVNTAEIEQMSGWLYKVARNKIIDKHRKKKPEPLEDYEYENGRETIFLKEVLLPAANDAESEYLKTVFWKELFAALKELPENQQKVFFLNELENIGLREIAEMEKENIKTIISRKGYAVKHLRKRLALYYEEFFEE